MHHLNVSSEPRNYHKFMRVYIISLSICTIFVFSVPFFERITDFSQLPSRLRISSHMMSTLNGAEINRISYPVNDDNTGEDKEDYKLSYL